MKKIIIALMAIFAIGTTTTLAAPKVEKKSVTTVFTTDIDCPHCSKKVMDTIPYEKGVKDVVVDVATKTITVTYDPAKTNDEALTKAIVGIRIKVFKTEPKLQ